MTWRNLSLGVLFRGIFFWGNGHLVTYRQSRTLGQTDTPPFRPNVSGRQKLAKHRVIASIKVHR